MSVYEPAEDSLLLLECTLHHLKKKKPRHALEMGTGSGLIAAEMAKQVHLVTAADISAEAIAYCKKNHMRDNLRFVRSDLFSKLGKKRYDLIIFNPPYLPNEKRFHDPALHGGKRGYETALRFLTEAVNYLQPDGDILLLLSSRSKPLTIRKHLCAQGLAFGIVAEKKLFFETLYIYHICLSGKKGKDKNWKKKPLT